MPRPFAIIGYTMLLTLAVLFFLPEWAVFVALGGFSLALVIALVTTNSSFTLRNASKRAQRSDQAPPQVVATSAAAGLIACLLLVLQLATAYYPALEHTAQGVEVRATITSNADARFGRYYYQLRTHEIDGQAVNLRMRLSSPVPVYAEAYDDIVFTGNIFLLGGDDPDMLQVHRARGVYLGTFMHRWVDEPYQVIPRDSFHPMRPILRLQRHMQRQLTTLYPGEESALFRAMLLGDQSGISWATGADFRVTGKWHIFSVSGLHMSVLAWTLLKVLRALRVNDKLAVCSCAAFVLFFMALTGFTNSCVRAGIMMLIMLAGELFNRRADALNSLGFAAMVLLAIDPLSAGHIGLQLSFAATLGIVLFANRMAKPLHKQLRLPKLFAEPLAVTTAALALTLPITLLRLPGGTSLLSFPANMVLTPLVGPAMILSGISVFIPWPPLMWLATQLARFMMWSTNWMAGLGAPRLQGDMQSLAFAFGMCAVIAAFALIMRWRKQPVPLRYTTLAVAVFMMIGGWLPGHLARHEIHVTQLGEGSYLVSQGYRAALLGAGDARAAKREMQLRGQRELQVMVLPTTQREHTAGAPEMQRDVPIALLIDAALTDNVRFNLWDDLTGILHDGRIILEWDGRVLVFE
ncbi:MAG: ComEC/Rec2 family competence protein [Oscillospiraceae bacterium]|nr:ComEC/Rec2 family competence protein [Oscillospiraceae bacterium]